MTPEQLAKSGTEHGHQMALFAWAALNVGVWPELKLMFAIPNGGERHAAVAANLKAEGVKAGVSDIFLPVARCQRHGLFIEMKKLKCRPTPTEAQLEFMHAMVAQGYAAFICEGWLAAQVLLIAYLSGELLMDCGYLRQNENGVVTVVWPQQ